MLLEILEVAVILLITVVLWQTLKKPSNYPPGPWGLPFIGSIPTGVESFNNKLLKLREKHPDVVSWRIGTKLIVLLFDYNLAKEVYQNPTVAYRPEIRALSFLQGEQLLGIIFTGGARWKTNRRFALKQLRDFGMGKSNLLTIAHYEAECFVNDLKRCTGTPTHVPHTLLISILNIVWQMVAKIRYEFDDEEIHNFSKLATDSQTYTAKLVILDIFPWIRSIVPEFLLNIFFKFHVQTELSEKIKAHFGKHINEHIKHLDENSPRDIIDAYLIEMKKQESNPESTMSIDDLTFCLNDLFEAATETTDLSIHWAILYLAKFPHIQKRLQREIDDILPKGTSFSMDHKLALPYTEAFIHELLRYSSVAPAPPRAANTDMKIGNYFIPKGTVIIAQTLLMHFDSRYFDSPKEFRPERFLDSEGKFSAPQNGFVPFGSGNRVCIGESIARMELFVFLTKLVQNFHFQYPPGEECNLEAVGSPFVRPPKGSPRVILTLR